MLSRLCDPFGAGSQRGSDQAANVVLLSLDLCVSQRSIIALLGDVCIWSGEYGTPAFGPAHVST